MGVIYARGGCVQDHLPVGLSDWMLGANWNNEMVASRLFQRPAIATVQMFSIIKHMLTCLKL